MSAANPQAQISDRLKAQLPMAHAWIMDTVSKPDEKLLEVLDERKRGMAAALRGVSASQSKYSPGEGQWCVDEVARHLAQANNRVAGLIEALASGYVPAGSPEMGAVPRDDRDFDRVKADLLKSFDVLRGVYDMLTGPGVNLQAKYRHPFFGEFNAREWFVFNCVHASVHVQQIERIKASAGFAAA